MGIQVDPFDILKSGINDAKSGYSKGKRQGKQLEEYGKKNPRVLCALCGVFFFVLGFLMFKYGKDMENYTMAYLLMWGLSAYGWIEFYRLGRKSKRTGDEE